MHRTYRAIVEAIERDFRVCEWQAGDIDLWPLAKGDLFLDLFRAADADTAPVPPSFLARAGASAAVPLTNLWKSRHDLPHLAAHPEPSDAILLGDGVSLDRVQGSWRDRFGEPIVAALERQGRSCFVMQSGNLTRLPWSRRTYAANRVAVGAAVRAAMMSRPDLHLPDHGALLRLLEKEQVQSGSFALSRLERRARVLEAQARLFDRILSRVRPRLAFVVTYYSGLGHAFALACRRRGLLCVDLQHCPHEGRHRAYSWSALPAHGYSTLPALFWAWTEADAASIRAWAGNLDQPSHGAIVGGHSQIAGSSASEREGLWRWALETVGHKRPFDREILVALQPIGAKRPLWEALAEQIRSGPPNWRWWIRRHPASTIAQDSDFAPLLSLQGTNIVVGEASQMPLPALLGHMDALISLASGAAAEAAMFGVPAFFLDEEALDTFPGMIHRRQAAIIGVGSIICAIRDSPRDRCPEVHQPSIEETLSSIDRLAVDYRHVGCRGVSDARND